MGYIKSQIPNLLTLCNLFSGCLGILWAINGDIKLAALMIVIGGFFDFLDGFVARLLGVSSDIGEQLDSLADMVTFGVLPGMILYSLISVQSGSDLELLKYTAFIFPICSAIRLARFNVSTEQTDKFIGLATPAASLFIVGLPFIIQPDIHILKVSPWILALVAVLLGILMISSLELFAFKLKDTSWAAQKFKYIFLLISILLLVLFKLAALPIIIILYIFTSIIENRILKKNNP